MEIKEEKLVKEEESVQGSTESSGLSDLDRKIIRQVEVFSPLLLLSIGIHH